MRVCRANHFFITPILALPSHLSPCPRVHRAGAVPALRPWQQPPRGRAGCAERGAGLAALPGKAGIVLGLPGSLEKKPEKKELEP